MLSEIAKSVRRVEEWILVVAVGLLAIFSIFNVITRTAFGFSLAFVEEASQFLMVWITFVGLSYAASLGRHIRMSAISDQLHPQKRRFLLAFMSAVTGATCLVLCGFAVQYLQILFALGTRSAALGVPLYLAYLVVPWGLALAAWKFALTAVRNIQGPGAFLSFTHEDTYDTPPLPTE